MAGEYGVGTILGGEVLEFLLDREARNLSKRTVEWYRQQLGHLQRYFRSESVRDIGTGEIRALLVHHAETHNPGGVHALYRALRAFWNWYCREYDLPNPMGKVAAPRVPRQILDPIELDDVKKMLATCRRSFFGARDRALLMFMLDTGCRRGEILALNVEDVNLVSGTVLIRQSKSGGFRSVFLGAKARKALLRYLRYREYRGFSALWVTAEEQRFTRHTLDSVLRRRAKAAGVKVPWPHKFRRAFAINCLRAGMDLVTLQRLLGHSTLAVVSRYLKQVDADLATAHQHIAPVDRFL